MTSPYEEGNPSSSMIILAQAPSSVEMRFQRPLMGPAGEVFRECSQQAGIARNSCYILNIWEQPVYTDKKSQKIYSYAGGPELWNSKGLTELGLELAEPTLERIRSSDANVILAMGQQALEVCTGKSKAIMKWRGSPLLGTAQVGFKKVIPTVHPAATIHGVYLWRYLIIGDMKKASYERTHSELLLPKRNIYIRPSLSDVLDYIRQCKKAKIAATDLEVINHQVSCFSLSKDPSEAICVPLTHERGDYWDEEDEVAIWLAYADLMYDASVMKVNQNIVGFDAPFLMLQNHILTRGPIGDTMIAQSVLYPEFNKGLDMIASMHTREPYWKDEGKMWKDAGGDFETFWRYNGKDSAVALETWNETYVPELTKREMWDTYFRHERLMHPLMHMTIDGLLVDQERLHETKVAIEAEIEALDTELAEVADYHFNANSSVQCAKYFYDHKGLDEYKNANGGRTTDDLAMSRIYRKTGLREAKLVQEIRNRKKLKGTYLEVEIDPDGRLRCSWNPRGTWTGRLSSSKTIFGTGMNLQNLDPRFKGFVVAESE